MADKSPWIIDVRMANFEEDVIKKSAEVPNGVVVEQVAGAAAKAGVRAGDVILALNNTAVKSPEQLRELIGKSSKSVALLVQREDARIFIPVTIG